jgi:hypothetical protein
LFREALYRAYIHGLEYHSRTWNTSHVRILVLRVWDSYHLLVTEF